MRGSLLVDTDVMASLDAPSGHLDALVAGKRVSPRLPVELPVRIKGAQREFLASAHDLSREGALILLDLAVLWDSDEEPSCDASEQFALVDRHFSQNFDLQFLGAPVVVEAQLIRLALNTDQASHVGLGCRFLHSLTENQERALGLRTGDDTPGDDASWDLATGVHDVCREANPARPVSALLSREGTEHAGPMYLGPIVRVGRSALVVRLEGADCSAAAAALAVADLRVRVLRGDSCLVDLPTQCAASRYIDAPRPGTEILLFLGERLPRSAWRLFRSA